MVVTFMLANLLITWWILFICGGIQLLLLWWPSCWSFSIFYLLVDIYSCYYQVNRPVDHLYILFSCWYIKLLLLLLISLYISFSFRCIKPLWLKNLFHPQMESLCIQCGEKNWVTSNGLDLALRTKNISPSHSIIN